MTDILPDTIFIACAGLGTRMRPITDTIPKPMVEIAGKPMIDHILDRVGMDGINHAVINLHYLGEQIETHLMQRDAPQISFSWEDPLLETGGGIKKALPLIGTDKPFYAHNSDVIFDNGPDKSAIQRMADFWDGDKMDILLMLFPTEKFGGNGNYDMDEQGRLTTGTRQMFMGLRILHPRVFDGVEDGIFSFKDQMDEAEKAGRLYGLIHDGKCWHVGTPDDVATVNALFTK